MERKDMIKFEGKQVDVFTKGGNFFEGRITRVYENSVWMEEGFHINIDDISTIVMRILR